MARFTMKLLAAGLGGCLLAATALAQPLTDAPAVHVRYSELDLSKDAGVERLYARLRQAADQVCGQADSRDLRESTAHDDCVKRALDASVASVKSARLTARHRSGVSGTQVAQAN